MFSLHQSYPSSDDIYLQQLRRRKAEIEAEERAILQRRAHEQRLRRIQEQEQAARQLRITQAQAEHRRQLHAQQAHRLRQQEVARALLFSEPHQSPSFLRREPRTQPFRPVERNVSRIFAAHPEVYAVPHEESSPFLHGQNSYAPDYEENPLSCVMNSVFGPQPCQPQAYHQRVPSCHAGLRYQTPTSRPLGRTRPTPVQSSAPEPSHAEGADFVKVLQEAFLAMNVSFTSLN
jgi:hypothetical protein